MSQPVAVLLLAAGSTGAPIAAKQHACSAVDMTNTDMSPTAAAEAFGAYLEAVEPVESMHSAN